MLPVGRPHAMGRPARALPCIVTGVRLTVIFFILRPGGCGGESGARETCTCELASV